MHFFPVKICTAISYNIVRGMFDFFEDWTDFSSRFYLFLIFIGSSNSKNGAFEYLFPTLYLKKEGGFPI